MKFCLFLSLCPNLTTKIKHLPLGKLLEDIKSCCQYSAVCTLKQKRLRLTPHCLRCIYLGCIYCHTPQSWSHHHRYLTWEAPSA